MGEDSPPGAILTPKQREWLHGESEIEPNSNHERTVRRRVRKRIQAGIADLSTIFWHLEDRDLEKVYEEMDFVENKDSMFGEEYIVTPAVIQHALAFFLQRYETDEGLERAIGEALARVADKHGAPRRYEVTIESEDVSVTVEDLKEGLEEGDLTIEDIRRLHGEGRLTWDAYLKIREWTDPEGRK